MVFYFRSTATSPEALIYMGKDKHENEELIKHALDIDIWFHADKYSSAHVYLRLNHDFKNIPLDLLTDIAQLTKANSIEGNKKDNITVIYTPISNLKKTGGMDTGQVSFHKDALVKKVLVKTRENAIINRLNKTKIESFPDLGLEKIEYEKGKRERQRNIDKALKLEAMKRSEEQKIKENSKGYKGNMKQENMKSNIIDVDLQGKTEKEIVDELEEDFM